MSVDEMMRDILKRDGQVCVIPDKTGLCLDISFSYDRDGDWHWEHSVYLEDYDHSFALALSAQHEWMHAELLELNTWLDSYVPESEEAQS